jgi:hypothetical protein
VSGGWLLLAGAILAYGFANFFQAIAATRLTTNTTLHPGLFLRLASHRTYLVGLLMQFGGFLCAFGARADLPLFLVQSAVAAGLGVTALLGVFVLHWQLPRAEVGLLITLGLGLTALIVSAQRSPSKSLATGEIIALGAAAIGIAAIGSLAVKLHGAPGSVALGCLAGLSFGAAAVASRPLAGAHSLGQIVTNPLLYILLVHAGVGQLMLGLALQRGSTTAAVAAMDASAAIPAALIGLFLLGDRIEPGLEWLAGVGFVVTLGSIIGLTRYAEPQHALESPVVAEVEAVLAHDRANLRRSP